MPDLISNSQELPPGTKLGDYIIERTLGQGGFGITYLAKDTTHDIHVVIKENLPFSFAYRDTTTLKVHSRRSQADEGTFDWAEKNFLNEANTLASLDHPHIVKVTQVFSALETAYFVMPYIEGFSLDKYREKVGTPTEEWLYGLLAALLNALDYLHQKGLLHRDLKPGNILLTEGGQPQLIDFGTARQMLSEKSQTVIESPGYTPFEQTESRGNVGPWSDLYALGGTLYKLITGETPLKSSDRVRQDPYLPLEHRPELQGHFSPPLLKSIDKALAVWPEDRWQSAEEWSLYLDENSDKKQPPPPHTQKQATHQSPPCFQKSETVAEIWVNIHWSYLSDGVPFPLRYNGKNYYLRIRGEGAAFFPGVDSHGLVVHATKVYTGDMYNRAEIPADALIQEASSFEEQLPESAHKKEEGKKDNEIKISEDVGRVFGGILGVIIVIAFVVILYEQGALKRAPLWYAAFKGGWKTIAGLACAGAWLGGWIGKWLVRNFRFIDICLIIGSIIGCIIGSIIGEGLGAIVGGVIGGFIGGGIGTAIADANATSKK